MQLIGNTIAFLDTGFFKAYKPKNASYHDLFKFAEDKKIILCTSQLCLDEWRTQKVRDFSNNLNTIKSKLSTHRGENFISFHLFDQGFYGHLEDPELLLSKSNDIIDTFINANSIRRYRAVEKHIEATWDAYFQGKAPFKSIKNKSDIPDAWIMECARDALKEPEHVNLQNRFCITSDITLGNALKDLDFQLITIIDLLALLQKEAQSIVPVIERHNMQILTNIISSEPSNKEGNLSQLDKILSTAISADIKDIYLRLLGFSQWMDSPLKEDLIAAIAARGFDSKLIEACAVLLSQKSLAFIRDTGNHYLPINKEVCQEAAERVMPEILQMLDQG